MKFLLVQLSGSVSKVTKAPFQMVLVMHCWVSDYLLLVSFALSSTFFKYCYAKSLPNPATIN